MSCLLEKKVSGNPQSAISNRQSPCGFSLVELIVVLAIVGLLAAFAIPNFSPQVQRNRIKAAKVVADSIRNALDMYSVEFSISPVGGAFLTSPGRISPFLYPNIAGSGTTSFLDALYTTLSAYLVFNPKNSLGGDGWGSYTLSPQGDGYTLVVRAQDRAQTLVTVVKRYQPGLPDNMTTYITAIHGGEEIPYP